MHKCEKCEKEFETEEALKQHTKDAHPEKIGEVVKKSRISKANVLYVTGLVAVILAFYLYYSSISPEQRLATGVGPVGSTHEHVDFKVYLNSIAIDFSQPKYQVKSPLVHVEGGDGDVIHKHATGVKIDLFLQSLGMKLNSTCFVTDTGNEFCNEGDKTLKFYVNNQSSDIFDDYEFHDLDKVLISYGNETDSQIQTQLASITNKAGSTSKT